MTTETTLGLTQIPVRERLLSAALELFNTRGYAATTVREIVEAAGVTKPVLYYHFQNKEGIYLHVMQRGFAEFEETVRESLARPGTAPERMRAFCTACYGLFERHEAAVRLMYAIYYGPPQGAPFFDFEAHHRGFEQAVRKILADGIAEGSFRDGDLEAMTWTLVGAFNIVLELKLCPPRELPADLLDRVLDVALASVVVHGAPHASRPSDPTSAKSSATKGTTR